MNRKKYEPPIAKAGASNNLMIRRAAWVLLKHPNAPHYDGKMIDPRYLPPGPKRDLYQAELRSWYLEKLDDRARDFLGQPWANICNPTTYSPSAHRTHQSHNR